MVIRHTINMGPYSLLRVFKKANFQGISYTAFIIQILIDTRMNYVTKRKWFYMHEIEVLYLSHVIDTVPHCKE